MIEEMKVNNSVKRQRVSYLYSTLHEEFSIIHVSFQESDNDDNVLCLGKSQSNSPPPLKKQKWDNEVSPLVSQSEMNLTISLPIDQSMYDSDNDDQPLLSQAPAINLSQALEPGSQSDELARLSKPSDIIKLYIKKDSPNEEKKIKTIARVITILTSF